MCHIITALPVGGTQTVLHNLIRYTDQSEFEMSVISLADIGDVGKRIRDLGFPVRSLGLKPSCPNPLALIRLAFWLRQMSPDVVQTWMYHADLIGGLSWKMARSGQLMWNLRQTDLDPRKSRKSTILIAKTCAIVSKYLPARIVCCSEASRHVHAALGYDDRRMTVIRNGVDTEFFSPNEAANRSFRQEIGVGFETPLIGLSARLHPQKDHPGFFAAARMLLAINSDVNFVLCGEDIEPDHPQLAQWLSEQEHPDHFHLLGRRNDMPRVHAALDIATSSSSFGEGFCNALIEAMASAVPCVATDIGDSAWIIGDTGIVVPKSQPKDLAEAWRTLLDRDAEQRAALGQAARRRAIEEFSLDRAISSYEQLYRETAEAQAATEP